jgi:hypothetical protein
MLEVLVALFLLSVALIGVAGAFPIAYYAVHGGRQFTTAAALGQEVIEGAKRLSFLAVTTANLTALYPTPPPGYSAYARQIQVEDISAAGAVVMKRVIVTTQFFLQSGQSDVRLETLIAR